ncbi:hypothetical protein BU25DRAFT_408611 [Macroventuria anomochaeta]|uniref:Uncharacterized protein n=1 Tax=Macroventuria anomochaeta TaxID=301207 RepID=A0ACB6S7S6_9PLEO|nr:uncharacterized protein BU25DRAFT_408611 [Macroventuria anomochaeta]KAF2630013.1 hypothetical protein BU25DRAFT_408611 [Macroventuria anomochaeta]
MNERAAPSDTCQAGVTVPYSDLFMPPRTLSTNPTACEGVYIVYREAWPTLAPQASQLILTTFHNYLSPSRVPEYHFTYPEMLQQRLHTAWVGTNMDIARQKLLHTVGEWVSMPGTVLYTNWVSVDLCYFYTGESMGISELAGKAWIEGPYFVDCSGSGAQ